MLIDREKSSEHPRIKVKIAFFEVESLLPDLRIGIFDFPCHSFNHGSTVLISENELEAFQKPADIPERESLRSWSAVTHKRVLWLCRRTF